MGEINIKEKREELYKSWQRLVKIANALLAQAEIDPLSVRASMIQQIVRVLSTSGKMLDEYEKHLKKVDEEPEIDEDTGEEVMTDEEAQLLEQYEKLTAGKFNKQTDSQQQQQADAEPEPTSINDDDLKEGFNYRRDK
jgi:hypothetical protein